MNTSIYRRRRLVNAFNMGASTLTMAFGLFWLLWILFTLLQHGLSGLSLQAFTQSTPPPGSQGALPMPFTAA
jgi:phosphate transport system permease protein